MTTMRRTARHFGVIDTGELPSGTEIVEISLRYPDHWFAPADRAPGADEFDQQTVSWMVDLGILTTDDRTSAVLAMRPGHYGGCAASMLPREQALLFTECLTMWLLWDDEIIEQAPDVSDVERYLAAIAGSTAPRSGDPPYAVAWRQICDELERLSSRHLRQRLGASMRTFVEHSIAEGKVARDSTPDERDHAEALEARAITIGFNPTTIVMEACGKVELPEEITTTREYQDFVRSSSVIMAIQNDIASLANDLRRNWQDANLILRHTRRYGCSLRQACGALIATHDEAVDECDALAAKLLHYSGGRQAIAAYLNYVRFMETGFGRYHLRAPRYNSQSIMDGGQTMRLVIGTRPNAS